MARLTEFHRQHSARRGAVRAREEEGGKKERKEKGKRK
jgi:hypothetical protein